MMIFKKIVLCILCCLLASFTFAQKLSVTGGKFAEENPTKIVLNAVDGKSTKIFMVESVYNTQGTTVVLSDGYFVPVSTSATSEKTHLICDTPAELTLDKGAISLLAGNSTDISDEFTINATGGTQYWNIKAEKYSLIPWGAMPISVGSLLKILINSSGNTMISAHTINVYGNANAISTLIAFFT